jgi:hypothetical protein
MATEIVGSLFGVTPELYQEQRDLMRQKQAMAFAQQDPRAQATFGLYRAGQQVGQALGGLMGAEDPQMRLISQRNALAKQFDVSTPEGLAQYGQALQQVGDTVGALQATALANQMSGQMAETNLTKQKLANISITGEREQQLQNALSQLPEDANEQQIQSVLRRYGDPKTVLQALERKSNLESQAQERQRIQEEKTQFMREKLNSDQEFKRELTRLQADLRSGTSSLQQQLVQEKIDALRQKKQDAIDKQLGTAEGVIENTKVVLNKIDEAEKLVGKGTTGFGSYLSVVPGTPARELSTVIGTIKARLGFDQLQQMRNASPTGGALGQVSNRELASLEGALASLDQGLSADALKQNLKQIKESYSRWQQTAAGKLPPDRREQMETPTQPGVVDFNSLKK